MKQHICKICKAKYIKKNPFQTWCSPDCGFELAKIKLKRKQREKEIQEKREWKKRKEEARRMLNNQSDPLQKAINTIVRLIDKDQPCIARPFEKVIHFDSGHVYSIGSHPSLRYHVWNIHKQSVKSNRDGGGEQHLMFEGIAIRYGDDVLKMVMDLPKKYPTLKLQDWEKKDALKRANQIIREMKAGAEYTRDQVNEMINIYK